MKNSTTKERLKTSGLGSPYPNSTEDNCSYSSLAMNPNEQGVVLDGAWTQTYLSSSVNFISYEMCDLGLFGQIP